MSDFIGLCIELALMIIVPITIPFIIIMVAGNLNYNEKIKRIVMLILSIIYNGIIGLASPMFCICTILLLGNLKNFTLIILIFIYLIILLPLNIFMKKKGKINTFLYIIINVAIFVLGFYTYVINMRGSMDL